MDRRTFLKYALASSVVVWVGDQIPKHLGLDQADIKGLFSVEPANAAYSAFPQSVASGDPQPNGITLWTRIACTASSARVAIEISSNPSFSGQTLRGVTVDTNPQRDYTVKAKITSPELKPFQTYYYRFIFNGTASRTGRFKTLPAPNANVDRVRFAYVSCSDYTNGYFNAYTYLAQEDVDFVVHLGDYIYETVNDPSFQNAQVRRIQLPSGNSQAETLEDYRFLYKTYKSDANLQRVHENFAFINVWDDHEFANDCYQIYDTDSADEQQNRAPNRRQAASQAWVEYTPASISFDANQEPLTALRIYRSFAFGNLLELVMTDERLYRDGPPCGLEMRQRYVTPGCANRNNPNRTMLGNTQRDWFLNKIRNSSRIWKIWGNEVMTMQLKVLSTFATVFFRQFTPDLFIVLDQWDGYPAERAQIFSSVRQAGVKNFVTITGDLHTFVAGYQKVNFDSPTEPPVGVCFVVGSISAANFSEQSVFSASGSPTPPINQVTQILRASNRHLKYFNSATHGYNLVEVTPQSLTCTMKAVDTVTEPQANLRTLKAYVVPRDQIQIQEVAG
ncbi:MAG TPA: phosphodiesterase [Cyanobacteria bacterium UBA8553]|nr:phosphodiesterase [Cyanobacteria bacterium UBA8553]HAJ64503.1 phosphodiesterase [Cyanobacteria bacterium UBA8543]